MLESYLNELHVCVLLVKAGKRYKWEENNSRIYKVGKVGVFLSTPPWTTIFYHFLWLQLEALAEISL